MKIQINNGSRNMNIALPTNWIFSSSGARIAVYIARKHAPEALKDISPEAMNILCAEIRRIKQKYGSWELVEVNSADGEKVIVTL